MKRITIAVLAIALIAAPGLLATSFALEILPSMVLLRCERDWLGRFNVRHFDGAGFEEQLQDLPRSCADALRVLLTSDPDGNEEATLRVVTVNQQCLTALPSGFNGVLYFINPHCLSNVLER